MMNDAEYRYWLALRRHTQCARLTAQQLMCEFDANQQMLASVIEEAAGVEAAIAATLNRRRQA